MIRTFIIRKIDTTEKANAVKIKANTIYIYIYIYIHTHKRPALANLTLRLLAGR